MSEDPTPVKRAPVVIGSLMALITAIMLGRHRPSRPTPPLPPIVASFPGPDEVLTDKYSGNELLDGTPLWMECGEFWYDVTVQGGHVWLPEGVVKPDCLTPVGSEEPCPNIQLVEIHQTVSVR